MTRLSQDALERRAKRLVHLIEISAPSQLIVDEVFLIFKSVILYYPDEVVKNLTHWLIPIRKKGETCARS